jgi:hypothetical protein
MNQIQHIKRINEAELESGTTSSWHDQVSLAFPLLPSPFPLFLPLIILEARFFRRTDPIAALQYKDSAYVNVGGLPFNLTEGDVITIFSQFVPFPPFHLSLTLTSSLPIDTAKSSISTCRERRKRESLVGSLG